MRTVPSPSFPSTGIVKLWCFLQCAIVGWSVTYAVLMVHIILLVACGFDYDSNFLAAYFFSKPCRTESPIVRHQTGTLLQYPQGKEAGV